MAIYGDTAQNTPSGTPLATTGVVATAATVTNVPWELDCVISNVTTGSSARSCRSGYSEIYSSATAIVANRISSSAANPNTAIHPVHAVRVLHRAGGNLGHEQLQQHHHLLRLHGSRILTDPG